jgi:hypothetical protein
MSNAPVIGRLSITRDGALRLKQGSRLVTVVLARRLLSIWASTPRGEVPEAGLGLLEARAASLQEAVAAAERAGAPTLPEAPAALDAALLALEPEEVLRAPRQVDLAIERRVRPVVQATASFLHRPAGDPRGEAARRVHELLFSEGRTFLRLPLEQQYQHVSETFGGALSREDTRAALALLGVQQECEEIARLNQHLGVLLQITAGAAAPQPAAAARDAAPLEELRGALAAWLSVVNAAWPGPGEADAQRRAQLLGPLLDFMGR